MFSPSGSGTRAPASLRIYCNLDPDQGLVGNFANVSVEGNTVRVFTSTGDSLGVDGVKCDSGKIEAEDADPQRGKVNYRNVAAGLELSFNGQKGLDGKIRGAVISGHFQDERSKKSCTVSGHFFCH